MINSRSIDDLHPTLKRGALELIKRCEDQGLKITITQTLRDVEYQNFLYAKGRTSAGKIVTNARGGSSYHNYGLAFDICKNSKGHEYDDLNFFESVGKVWESMGGTWGGHFKTIPDKPHFEFAGDMKLEDLKNGAKLNTDTNMSWEENNPIVNSIDKVEDRGKEKTENIQEDKKEIIVEQIKYLVQGQELKLNTINYNGKNYIEVRELSKLGMEINYDNLKKIPIISYLTSEKNEFIK